MKATLEFILPEEETEHHDAVNGTGYRSAYRAVLEQIRNWKKHGHNIVCADAALNVIYDEMLEQLENRCLDVYNP
jgi:hypothetical protein